MPDMQFDSNDDSSAVDTGASALGRRRRSKIIAFVAILVAIVLGVVGWLVYASRYPLVSVEVRASKANPAGIVRVYQLDAEATVELFADGSSEGMFEAEHLVEPSAFWGKWSQSIRYDPEATLVLEAVVATKSDAPHLICEIDDPEKDELISNTTFMQQTAFVRCVLPCPAPPK